MLVYVLSLLAALLVGGAAVIQQRAASQAPPEYNLSVRLLAWLAQRPLWLGGVAASVLGNIVFSIAVGMGSVALAEALLTVRLLFALPLAAVWGRHTVPARDWGGAIAITAGLIGFLLAAQPGGTSGQQVPVTNWIIGGGTVVAIVAALAAAARGFRPTRKAPLLAAGAGMLFGLQASLMHTAINVLSSSGIAGLLTTWKPYAVILVAVTGMLLIQSAYELAPLPASYPVLVSVELIAGIAVGVGVVGGAIRLAPIALGAGILCLGIMVFGIWILTTSPLVTGELDRLEARQEEGMARITEDELERDLRRASHDLDSFEAHLQMPRERRRERGHVERDLSRIHEEIDRLEELLQDIRRHREAEKEHLRDVPEEERIRVAKDYESLPEWESEVADRADRLRDHAQQLDERARAIDVSSGSRRMTKREAEESADDSRGQT